MLFVNPNFWTLGQAYPVDGTLVIHQIPKTGDFLSMPTCDFIEMEQKNTFGVLLMKSEYGQIKVLNLFY